MSAEETRASVQRQLFLRTMSVARPAGGSTEALAKMMRDVFFPAGSKLYSQGEPPEDIYFIVSGSAELRAPDVPPVSFDDRSVLGVMDMLQDIPHARDAVAVTDVRALAIRTEDWLELLEDNFEFSRSAIVNISESSQGIGKELGDAAGFAEPAGGEGEAPPSRPLNVVERLLVLRALPAFARTRIQALTSLAEIASEVRLSPGEVLFREREPQAAIFAIAIGSVELVSETPAVRARFGPRSLVAGPAAFAPTAGYTASARAPSVLLKIAREDLFDVMEDKFEVARSVLAFLATERSRLGMLRARLPPRS